MGAALKQTTFSTAGFDRYTKTTKRAAFLAEMDQVVPWAALCGLVEPFYPKGETGRRPFGIERIEPPRDFRRLQLSSRLES